LDGRRVLIVDDRRDMRYLIQTYVEEAGATAASAGDGAAAVDCVRAAEASGTPFDAIVLDMQMPVMDGFRATPALRQAGHGGLIVALTASAMKGDEQRCLAVGCDEYLSKPVDRLRLLYLLARGKSASGARARTEAAPDSPRASSAAANPAASPVVASYRRRVLVVDDNADAAELLAMVLDGHEIEVTTASSGAEAVERARSTRPEVVVLDLGLPDMDGYAVLEHLQALEHLRGARYIALTGRSSQEDRQRMREAGFHHQLVKPAEIEQLLELIRSNA
jgi:two-component system CheB/CheR fusion protein